MSDFDRYKQCISYWRRDVSDAQVIYQNQTELYRIHSKSLDNRKEQRGKDQNGRCNIHKGTCDQQDHVHDQKNDHWILGQSQKRCRDSLRNLSKGHNPSQNIGNADKEYHHTAHLCALHHDVPQRFQCNIAVADAQDQSVDHGDGRALCCRKDTCDDAADDHDDQGQRRNRSQGADPEIFPVKFARKPFVALFLCNNNGNDHTADGPDNSRHIPCHEQGSYGRSACCKRISDQRIGRRDQKAGWCGCAVGGSAQRLVVALLLLAFFHHASHCCCGSGCRSGDCAEQSVGSYIGYQKGARHFAQDRHNKVYQPLGDAALIHQVARQNKERDSRQAEFAHAYKDSLSACHN